MNEMHVQNVRPPALLEDGLPTRKQLQHTSPFNSTGTYFFITICASQRGGTPFLSHAEQILSAARHRHVSGKWFLALFLIMPDHLHALVTVPPPDTLTRVVADFKRYLATFHGVSFQANYFDTRIRDDAHFAEKWNYITNNPVAKGLVASAKEWPHAIAFDRRSGLERQRESTS